MPCSMQCAASPTAELVTTSPFYSYQSPPSCRRSSSQKGPTWHNQLATARCSSSYALNVTEHQEIWVSQARWRDSWVVVRTLRGGGQGNAWLEYLPEAQRPWVKATLTRAYTHTDIKAARRLLQDLARRLDVDYPSAAASIREGLDETLTVVELQLSERLRRSLATTNAVESLLSRTRHVKRNVKRWHGSTMVLRWVAAGVLEAAKGFRRVKGCRDMPVLVAALRARDAQLGLDESSGMVA